MEQRLIEVPFHKGIRDEALAEVFGLKWKDGFEVRVAGTATADDNLHRFTITGTPEGGHAVYWTEGETNRRNHRPIEGLQLLFEERTAFRLNLIRG